jgi:hypothetical protein
MMCQGQKMLEICHKIIIYYKKEFKEIIYYKKEFKETNAKQNVKTEPSFYQFQ